MAVSQSILIDIRVSQDQSTMQESSHLPALNPQSHRKESPLLVRDPAAFTHPTSVVLASEPARFIEWGLTSYTFHLQQSVAFCVS